jgi:glyoxylase-like metal-dependent hydrolase (beta-lactamase superfamily II)
MKKIKKNIYFESSYSGATVGAFLFSNATVLVDAPLRPEDGRSWLAELKKAGANPKRLAVNLDSHPDRTLGVQTLDAESIAHDETARQFRRRAAIFKALKQESGAEWEQTPGLSGLRWIMPRVTFSNSTQLRYDEKTLRVEEHPEVGPGACWVISDEDRVIFVGDAITIDQPVFLSQAKIEPWLKSLQGLLAREYRDYTIIAGRGGKATGRDIKQTMSFLKDVRNRLKKLAGKKTAQAEIDKLAVRYADKYKNSRSRTLYLQRLRFGMQDYFQNHFAGRSRRN